jgi:hypothetical protein
MNLIGENFARVMKTVELNGKGMEAYYEKADSMFDVIFSGQYSFL